MERQRPQRHAAVAANQRLFGVSDSDTDDNIQDSDGDLVEENASTNNDSQEDNVITDDESGSEDENVQNQEQAPNQQDLLSRNGEIRWLRQPNLPIAQHRRYDILRQASGPTLQAINRGCGDSPAMAFKIFMN